MSRIVIALFSFLLLVPQGLRASGTLTTVVMTNQTPDSACTQPPAVTSFSPTDQAAWLWFLVSNVSVGDDYSVAFYTPAGSSLAAPSDFGPETEPGTFCYAVGLNIAGYTPATTPGTWNAYIFNRGVQIYKQPFTIGGSTVTCSYSLSSPSANIAASGGSGSFTVNVTAGTGCSWTASTDVSWISGSVSGSTVSYTVSANTGSTARVGHVTAAGQTFTITQAGVTACTYTLSGSGASSPGITGGTFNVTAPAGCAWTAVSSVSWITTTSSGNGNGTVTYTVAANPSTSSRTGTITVGGQTFTVTQGGASGGGTTTGNLIVDGDAESAAAVPGAGSEPVPPGIPGWTTDGIMAVVAYTDTAGDLSDWTPPSNANFGKNYFSGGYGASAKMTQTINLSSYATAIDAGGQGYTLDGWLGGWSSQDDNAVLQVTFLSASGATLGTASIGPVLAADRKNLDSLVEKTATGTVPSGTRSVLATLTITRVSGSYNDGCADNLSFVLGGGGGSTATGNFTFNGFNNTAGLTLAPPPSAAAFVPTSDGTVLRLTPATGNQSGAAYSTTPVTLGNNATFSTQFQFRFTKQGGTDPADGITFVLATSASGLGGLGVGIGYAGVGGKSVAIEFDTYNNGSGDGNSSNHVAIDTNGTLTNTNLTNVYGKATCDFSSGYPNTAAGCMSNGDLWTVNINYDGSKLTVTLTDPAEGSSFTAINNYPINLASILGQNTAYVGFTSGTGAGWENHDIVNWTFANTAQSTGTTGVSVYYRFENGTAGATATGSGSIVDSMGSQNGTPSGAVAYSSDVPLSTVGGAANTLSANFASNGSVQFPGVFPLNTLANATLEFYIKPTGTGSEMDFLWTRTDSSDANRFNMGVLTGAGGKSIFLDYREVSGAYHSLATIAIASSGWTHVAVVKSGNTWTSYANGVQQSTVTDSSPNLPNNTGWTLNGRGSPQFAGLLDEFRISNSALTPSQFLAPVTGTGSTAPWTLITSSGDCSGFDMDSSSGSSIPVSSKCTSAFNGYTAVCWPSTSSWDPNGCTYKNITAASCSGGSHPGYVYRCDAGTATTCTYSLSATSASPGAAQSTGSVSVTVTSGSGCSWTAVSNATWIHVTSGATGTGGGAVNYSVDANTGAARSGTLTIAGLTYTVNQAAGSGGPPTGCNYYVSPLSQSQPATGSGGGNITGLIMVTTGTLPNTTTGCPWTAASNNSWITIVSGTSSAGSGAVSYKVDPNTQTTSRTGTMSIAYQTVTVSQAAGVACGYSISPTSDNIQALGGSSSITVAVTGGNSCSWTASVSSTASSWLHLGSTTSGSGNGSVNYTADPNTSTASRTGTITVAGQTFTVTQAGGASANGPTIGQGGIVNAASNRGGGIAQGSFFTIYGSNLGPATPQQVYQFPIPDNLGGVTVTITQGSTTVKAYMFYVSATQINAIMPSGAPLGNVQIAVNYNGSISSATAATIVSTAYGIFSTAYGSGPGIVLNYNSVTDQPLNMASIPAKPGQVEVMWGTGLGPISTPDNQAPPGGNLPVAVQVWVGGVQASVAYSGRAPGNAAIDQINFTVPAGVATGCSIPVQVNAGGAWSNTVRMAISADGSHCQDLFNPYSGLSATGGKSGTLGLIRVDFSGQLDSSGSTTTASLDLGFGAFAKTNPGSDLVYSPLTNLPPPGTCASTNKMLDLGAVMGNGGASLDPTVAAALDAGAQLTVTGGAGGASGTIAPTSPGSPYMGLLGGILNVSGATLPPPFLDGGPFTITGPGGADVGKFSTTVALSPSIAWTSPPSTINRTSPLTVNWTGGDSTQTVVILAGSTDQTSKATGGFMCVAPPGAHTFTVPVNSLSDLIPTGTAAPSSSGPIGMLGLMPMHLGNPQKFTAPGLDTGVVFDTHMIAQTVQVQ